MKLFLLKDEALFNSGAPKYLDLWKSSLYISFKMSTEGMVFLLKPLIRTALRILRSLFL